MLIELKKLEGMAVGALDEGVKIGAVRRIVVNPESIKLIGFVIKSGTVLAAIKAVSFLDVVDIDRNGIVIRSRDNLVEVGEVVRIGELVKKRFSLIGLPVKTKGGKSFGRVVDAVVETTTGDILRIYTKYLFHDFVFERSQIQKITLGEVVVKDDSGEAKAKRVLSGKELGELV
jgi:uncharacterized protein YrrD